MEYEGIWSIIQLPTFKRICPQDRIDLVAKENKAIPITIEAWEPHTLIQALANH
jgi:hypothetical protein